MYLKKKIQELMKDFDNEVELPSRFYQYLEKIKESHKLIIKSKNGYHCQNCNNDFKKDRYKVQFGEKYVKCSYCKKYHVVKSNRVKHYKQVDYFCIIENFKERLIFRFFSVKTDFQSPNIYSTKYCEYGRKIYSYSNDILNLESEIYNDNVTSTISGKWVNYNEIYNSNWKLNGSYYYGLGDSLMLYPYNLKKVLKGTKWEYSQIWDFAKHIDYFDIESFFRRTSRTSLEMLIKNRLYNLTYSIISDFGSGPAKLNLKFLRNNLEFVRKYNLNLNEYALFEKTNIKNIKLIRKYAPNYDDLTDTFLDLKIDLEKANKLIKNLDKNFVEYVDYLEICEMLQYDMKDKKILYPQKDIVEEHDRVNALYNACKNKVQNNAIKKRAKELENTIYKNNKYIVFPVKNQRQLFNESEQQSNCVKTYAPRIAKGECDIYFMRLLETPNKSLVTVEVRNNKIVQKRTKFNQNTTKEQDKFLKKWEKEILNRKEKSYG